MSETENPDIRVLKSCLNKEIEEIFVTGYSEIKEGYNYFEPMLWWYYIKFEDSFLCISDSDIGVLKFNFQKEIKCNFDIEEEDVFMVSTVNTADYSGQKIISYDVFFGSRDNHIYGIGIQCEDNKYLHKNNKYIFFDLLSFDGIEFGNKAEKERYLTDDGFRLVEINSASEAG